MSGEGRSPRPKWTISPTCSHPKTTCRPGVPRIYPHPCGPSATGRNHPKNRNKSPTVTPLFAKCPWAAPICPRLGFHPDCRPIALASKSGSKWHGCSAQISPLVKSSTNLPIGCPAMAISRYRAGSFRAGMGNGSNLPSCMMALGTLPMPASNPFRLNMIFITCAPNLRVRADGRLAVGLHA